MASMSLQAAYDQARQSLESNDLDRAIGLAQHILDQYPDNLEAYRILGEAYLANRQLDRAQESFERVLRSDPENIPAHVGLGITAERQAKLDRAIAEFEQALEIKPDMTELRSQLLRLYSEGFGSENAQLRLSRAGLARLYAKGHMLPQAITEFRQVINDQPERFDAMVALAEALWRDGQEDEAIDLCRDILAERPESLKANLLLGYLLSSAGRPEGERYWQAAIRMDPYQSVAQALFESLPQDQSEPPMIEEWDEVAWRNRRAAEQQEQIAATRPMEAVTPAGTPSDSTSVFGAGWLEEPATPSVASSRGAASSETDDFLASLLALDSAPPPPSTAVAPISEEDLGLDADMMPFSLEDLDSTAPAKPAAPPADQVTPGSPAAPTAQDEPEVTPFSLSDLGLSDEEIASMNDLSGVPAASEPPAAPTAQDEPEMTPFSLSDLGLSDEEIASLGNATNAAPAQPSVSDDQPTITPFSLNDLGLSDDELAGLDSLQTESEQPAPSAPAHPRLGEPSNHSGGIDAADTGDLPIDLQPFSFDDLDLNAESDSVARTSGLPSSLQPFSLEDAPPQRPRVSGFSAAESSKDEAAADEAAEEDTAAEPRGYSWQQASQKPEPSFLKPAREDPLVGDVSIFSKLKQQHDTLEPRPDEPLPPVPIEPDEHLGLFSLDDIPLREDADEPAPQSGAPVAEPPAAAPPPEIENLDDALASGQVQPFSFADLGLSEEEIALLEGATLEAATPAEQPEAPAAPEIENLEDALASGQVQPFSLSDVGLSDDEIATMGISEAEAPDAEVPELPAAQIDEFDVETPASPTSNAPAQSSLASGDEEGLLVSDIKPFSLTDLGLSEEEIQALGLDSADESEESGDVGLGLTEEELEGLDGGDLNWAQQPSLPEAPPAEQPAPPADQADQQVTSGDLVVDRLIALGHQQGYIDISDIIANFEDPEAEAARIEEIGRRLHEAKIEIRDGDEVIDMEAEYAEEQPGVEAPGEAPPASETPIPPRPAQPSRDLDLITEDLDAPSPAPAAEPASAEPSMTPFSLSDLGLTDEEIAALGLDTPAAAQESPATDAAEAEQQPPAAEPASAEPSMAPFSLSDLGLTDEEIAALGLDTPAAAEEPPAVEPAAPAEQPITEMTAPEEQPPAAEPASAEPSMTPFSLSDLGLTDEEIAALGLDTSTAESSAGAPEVSAPSEAGASNQDMLGSLLETTEQAPAAPPETTPVAPQAVPATPPAPPETTPVAPQAAPVAPQEEAPVARAAAQAATPPVAPSQASIPTGNDVLDMFLSQLESDPDNDVLRLSVARAGTQIGMTDLAVQQYKYLIKHSRLLNDVVGELQDLIADNDDARVLQRLHRTLGDALSKQGRLREAIEEYSWTLGGPRGRR
jgi:tetratricopeptide (TPR) repeat protein